MDEPKRIDDTKHTQSTVNAEDQSIQEGLLLSGPNTFKKKSEVDLLKLQIQEEIHKREIQIQQYNGAINKISEVEALAKNQISQKQKSVSNLLAVSTFRSSDRLAKAGTRNIMASTDSLSQTSIYKEFESYKLQSQLKLDELEYLLKEERTKTARFTVLKLENQELLEQILQKDTQIQQLNQGITVLNSEFNDMKKFIKNFQDTVEVQKIEIAGLRKEKEIKAPLGIGQPGYVRQTKQTFQNMPTSNASKLISPRKSSKNNLTSLPVEDKFKEDENNLHNQLMNMQKELDQVKQKSDENEKYLDSYANGLVKLTKELDSIELEKQLSLLSGSQEFSHGLMAKSIGVISNALKESHRTWFKQIDAYKIDVFNLNKRLEESENLLVKHWEDAQSTKKIMDEEKEILLKSIEKIQLENSNLAEESTRIQAVLNQKQNLKGDSDFEKQELREEVKRLQNDNEIYARTLQEVNEHLQITMEQKRF